jgi:phospholipase C
MRSISRRKVLIGMGSLVTFAGCGTAVDASSEPSPADAGGPPKPDAGAFDASKGTEAGADAGTDAPTPTGSFGNIDTVVVLMMENRSFDHYLGQLKRDASSPLAATVEGLTGTESNLAPDGSSVPVFNLTDFTVVDPPHGWDAAHGQFNGGLNDGFVKRHAGPNQNEVMGYHDRVQIPFMYWLADNYTVCDHWFSSVMGPTWPNRYYLHATTAGGKKDNRPILPNVPRTVWDELKDKGKTFANYYAGAVTWYAGGFPTKLLQLNPAKRMDTFFQNASAGTLPNFSIIDPDFQSNDDHPDHDIQRGQAFIASVYKALAASPQWNRMLFVIIYDEHGGFYDHVPPPTTVDPDPEFKQLGFRIPAIVIGPTVRRGAVVKTQFEHSSVAATLRSIFGIDSLGPRMAATSDLGSCIDPALIAAPKAPALNPPPVVMSRIQALTHRIGTDGQPELAAMMRSGQIPVMDPRDVTERTEVWLAQAEALGAVVLTR